MKSRTILLSCRKRFLARSCPFLLYDTIDEVISRIKARPKPLSLYLFTGDNSTERRILQSISFGGGCINDTLIHAATPYMGFGGVGNSGMGSYHGKLSFDTVYTLQKHHQEIQLDRLVVTVSPLYGQKAEPDPASIEVKGNAHDRAEDSRQFHDMGTFGIHRRICCADQL